LRQLARGRRLVPGAACSGRGGATPERQVRLGSARQAGPR